MYLLIAIIVESECRHRRNKRQQSNGKLCRKHQKKSLQKQNFYLEGENRLKENKLEELLYQNDQFKQKLQKLKNTNKKIEKQVQTGYEQIKKIRKEIDIPILQRKLSPKYNREDTRPRNFQEAQILIKQLQISNRLNENKFLNEKTKCNRLQNEIRELRTKIEQIQQNTKNMNYNKSKKNYHTLSNENQEYNQQFKGTKWKSNFINVFLDMMNKIGKREGFQINQHLSEKKRTKIGWKYLKDIILDNYEQK